MAIDIYLPSVYFENMKKYSEKYNEVAEQRKSCTDEDRRRELKAEMKDLYKKKLSRGYFREGNNNFYLLERVGLNWGPFLSSVTQEGKMPIETVAKLKDALSSSQFIPNFKPKPHPLAFLMRSPVMTDADKEGLKRKLILLCDEAIKRNEPLQINIIGSDPLTSDQIQKLHDQENEF